MDKIKHDNERAVTFWMSRDLIAELDQHIAASCHGIPGARPSRQRYLINLVRQALATKDQAVTP